jgi:hypothetical protein
MKCAKFDSRSETGRTEVVVPQEGQGAKCPATFEKDRKIPPEAEEIYALTS